MMENFPEEKRRFPRTSKILPIKVKIIDEREEEISPYISLKTKNMSQGGMQISWPKGWMCRECTPCSSRIYNRNCDLRIKNEEELRPVSPNTYLRIDIELITAIFSRVAWIGNLEKERDQYYIGISFVKKTLRTSLS